MPRRGRALFSQSSQGDALRCARARSRRALSRLRPRPSNDAARGTPLRLGLGAGSTKCHHIRGIEYIGEHVPRGRNVTFESAGHWLYYEEPARFNAELLDFIQMAAAEGAERKLAAQS